MGETKDYDPRLIPTTALLYATETRRPIQQLHEASIMGWGGRKDDRLLDYFHREPLKEGEVYFDPDCLVLGRNDEVVSKKGNVLDREDFEKMKSKYYELRGWDIESGLPTERVLEELDLVEVSHDLESPGLIK